MIAGVLVVDEEARPRAERLAARLRVDVVDARARGVVLAAARDRLELRLLDDDAPGPVAVDFAGGRVGWRRAHPGGDALAQALGKKKRARRIVDATAGLGRDAAAIAHAGFEVVAIERSPVVCALLADGARRAGGVERLRFVCADAASLLRAWAGTPAAPDAVYLDPMYAPKKKAAAAQKEMVLLRAVVGGPEGLDELFDAARAAAKMRVVVKRPAGEPPRFPHPTHSYVGRSTTFDLYAPYLSQT